MNNTDAQLKAIKSNSQKRNGQSDSDWAMSKSVKKGHNISHMTDPKRHGKEGNPAAHKDYMR